MRDVGRHESGRPSFSTIKAFALLASLQDSKINDKVAITDSAQSLIISNLYHAPATLEALFSFGSNPPFRWLKVTTRAALMRLIASQVFHKSSKRGASPLATRLPIIIRPLCIHSGETISDHETYLTGHVGPAARQPAFNPGVPFLLGIAISRGQDENRNALLCSCLVFCSIAGNGPGTRRERACWHSTPVHAG